MWALQETIQTVIGKFRAGDILIVPGSPDRIRAFARVAGGEMGEAEI
jgi:hypothetical protein